MYELEYTHVDKMQGNLDYVRRFAASQLYKYASSCSVFQVLTTLPFASRTE